MYSSRRRHPSTCQQLPIAVDGQCSFRPPSGPHRARLFVTARQQVDKRGESVRLRRVPADSDAGDSCRKHVRFACRDRFNRMSSASRDRKANMQLQRYSLKDSSMMRSERSQNTGRFSRLRELWLTIVHNWEMQIYDNVRVVEATIFLVQSRDNEFWTVALQHLFPCMIFWLKCMLTNSKVYRLITKWMPLIGIGPTSALTSFIYSHIMQSHLGFHWGLLSFEMPFSR